MLKWTRVSADAWRSSDGHVVVRDNVKSEREMWRVRTPDGGWLRKTEDRFGRKHRIWYRSSEAAREAVEYGPDRKNQKEMRRHGC